MSRRGERLEERELARKHGSAAASGIVKARRGRSVDITPDEFVAMTRAGLSVPMPTVEEFVFALLDVCKRTSGSPELPDALGGAGGAIDRALAAGLVERALDPEAVISRCADCDLKLRPFVPGEGSSGGRVPYWVCWCGWIQTSTAGGCAELCFEAVWGDVAGYCRLRDVARAGGYQVPDHPPHTMRRNVGGERRRRERAVSRGDGRALEVAIRRGEVPPWRDERLERLALEAIGGHRGDRLDACFDDFGAVCLNAGESWGVVFPRPGDERLLAFAVIVGEDSDTDDVALFTLSFSKAEASAGDCGRRVVCDRESFRGKDRFMEYVRNYHPGAPLWSGVVEGGRIVTRGREDVAP